MSVKGARVAVLGVSYKPGVGDIRESPALKIIELLREMGADVCYHDPHVAQLAEFGLSGRPLDEAIADADLTLIVTAHPGDRLRAARAALAPGRRPAWRDALAEGLLRRDPPLTC